MQAWRAYFFKGIIGSNSESVLNQATTAAFASSRKKCCYIQISLDFTIRIDGVVREERRLLYCPLKKKY